MGVFAKHGFHGVAEKIKLGKFIIERLSATEDLENLTIPERLRRSFEELGPTFVKLGQVLASRPDLIPEEYTAEFEKLHDRVQSLPFEVIEGVLKEEFGERLEGIFSFIDPEPLGAASIAQVHKARLVSGETVVIKVQRPGIIQTINDDLNVLYMLSELLTNYVPETRMYNPMGIVDEFFKTLELETNFVVEANNIRRFDANFANDPDIKIPKVYMDLTTERVLTMEALEGLPLSQDAALRQADVNAEELIRKGLRAYMKMVFADGLFHGDLHAGNFFVLPHNQIGLIDFGVVGRLNSRVQTSIANMLLALSREDYERLAFEYVDLAPFSDQVNVDLFARELRQLIAPYYGLTMKNINLGKILMSSSGIAARHHLSLPTDLMLFFKSIVSIEGIGRRLIPDFDFLQYAIEVANEIVRHQVDPNKAISEITQVLRETKNFIHALPRQANFLLRKINSPGHAFRLNVPQLEELKKSVEVSFNLIFLGMIIGALILSASYIFTQPTENHISGMPTMSFVQYTVALILGIVAFFNYIKK